MEIDYFETLSPEVCIDNLPKLWRKQNGIDLMAKILRLGQYFIDHVIEIWNWIGHPNGEVYIWQIKAPSSHTL